MRLAHCPSANLPSSIYQRRSIRLQGYDYAQPGAYFVTVCAHHRKCLFGEIVDGRMLLNAPGQVVSAEWAKSAQMRREIELGQFVIMPNHFHGIVIINGNPVGGAYGHTPNEGNTPPHPGSVRSPSKTVGAMVRGFKSAVTKQINTMRKTPGVPVWQRNYYEHIIRDDSDYLKIAEYIATNPLRWKEDRLHPDNRPECVDRGGGLEVDLGE